MDDRNSKTCRVCSANFPGESVSAQKPSRAVVAMRCAWVVLCSRG